MPKQSRVFLLAAATGGARYIYYSALYGRKLPPPPLLSSECKLLPLRAREPTTTTWLLLPPPPPPPSERVANEAAFAATGNIWRKRGRKEGGKEGEEIAREWRGAEDDGRCTVGFRGSDLGAKLDSKELRISIGRRGRFTL